jgi:hypothetical protein
VEDADPTCSSDLLGKTFDQEISSFDQGISLTFDCFTGLLKL